MLADARIAILRGMRFVIKNHLLAVVVLLPLAFGQEQKNPAGVPPVPDYVPAGALHSVIIMSGNKAGDEFAWKSSDGKLHTFSQYNDRGRGPRIDGLYQLNEKGWPTQADFKGNDYLKANVEEHFTFDGKQSSWKSKSEEGSALGLSGFYPSNYGPTEEFALTVRALLANGGTLPLLPVGTARLQKLRTESVELDGKPAEVTLYSVSGFGFTPARIWLDKDNQFFATPGTWFAQVRAGGESSLPKLLAIEQDLDKKRSAELAQTLVKKPAKGIFIHDVALFDADNAKIVPHQSVVVIGNKISQVGAASAIKTPAGATVIEGKGLTLLPGLWDMHAHVSPLDGMLNLATGVTTVRDLANDVDELMARKKRIEEGQEIGTRIIAAGFLDGSGPFHGPTKALVDTPEQVREWVSKYHALGYPQIKMYSSIKPELVPVIVEEAHKNGMRVSGHIPAGLIATDAFRAGFDEMQHMNFVFLNFMPDVKETRTPARFVEPAKRSADIDVKSKPVQDFIAMLKAGNKAVDPTMVAFEGMITGRPGHVDPSFVAVADRMPTQVRRGFLGGGLEVPDDATDKLYKSSFENWKKMLKELYDHGVTLDVGTDSLAGFAYQRELELFVESGIPAAQTLKIATITSARTMKRDSDLGSIEAGKLADMSLVPGDPTTDISVVRRTRTTIKDGKIYEPSAIYRELGVKPAE